MGMTGKTPGPFLRQFGRVERLLTGAIASMMLVAIVLGTIDLGIELLSEVLNPPFGLLDVQELLDLFGVFLVVLIGLELLQTVKHYLSSDKVRADLVLLIAVIAITRKIIIKDWSQAHYLTLVGLGILVMALAGAYYLVAKAERPPAPRAGDPPVEN